ncbi:MAG: hypothetical protein JWN23_2796 [Rhodocyclales bacterium]|nr:hypothetical protein [Rhodocyclales bacterium]
MTQSSSATSTDDPQRKPRLGLFAWINLGVVATVLLIVVPLLFLVNRFASGYAERQAGESLSQIAWQMRDALDRGMSERYDDISRLANANVFADEVDPVRTRPVLDRLKQSVTDYAWIGVALPDGKVVAATGGLLEGTDASAEPWFKGALKGPFVGDVHDAVLSTNKLPESREPRRFVDIAMPLRNRDGQLTGVVATHLSWAWARNVQLSLIDPRQQSLNVEMWILNRDGDVLLGPAARDGDKLQLVSVAAAKAGKQGYLFEKWPDGKRYATSYIRTQGHKRYPGLGWIVLAREHDEVAFAAFLDLQKRLLAVSIGIFGVVLVMANLLAWRIARPLAGLARAADRHGTGGMQAPILLADDYREAFVLSRAVANMVAAEQRHSRELEDINASLEARVDERTLALQEANDHLGRALGEQATAENAALASEAVLSDILRNVNEAYVSIDAVGRITAWNREAERIFGWTRDEVLGKTLDETIMPRRQPGERHPGITHFLETAEGSAANQRVELIALRRDGSEFPVEVTTSVVKRGNDLVISGLMHDISERKALEQRLERQALEDTLTGLPNRRALLERLPLAMARADRWSKAIGLLFLDLDGFKNVNDTLGHDMGDELLRQFARRLQGCVRQTDTVARLAGDEFTILLESLTSSAEDARNFADKIIASMQMPFQLGDHSMQMSTSIGIAVHMPLDKRSADALLTRADAAMYVAKRSGKNRWHLSEAIPAVELSKG